VEPRLGKIAEALELKYNSDQKIDRLIGVYCVQLVISSNDLFVWSLEESIRALFGREIIRFSHDGGRILSSHKTPINFKVSKIISLWFGLNLNRLFI
jgi:hypothetical protein